MDSLEHAQIRKLIARICNAESLAESYDLYKTYFHVLRKCKFVFSAENGGYPAFAVNKTFPAGGAIRSLFSADKVFVLDEAIAQQMESGFSTFPIDYSISLDTQALSYLEPYLRGSGSRLPADFAEVFSFIARLDVWVDPIPYLHENLANLDTPRGPDRIFEKLPT